VSLQGHPGTSQVSTKEGSSVGPVRRAFGLANASTRTFQVITKECSNVGSVRRAIKLPNVPTRKFQVNIMSVHM
jgi:hypothetical protein